MVNLCINARLGDGSLVQYPTCKHPSLQFMGVEEEWIRHKWILSGCINNLGRVKQDAKAFGTKPIYRFHDKPRSESSKYLTLPKIECIKEMDIEDLIFLYLDDGSLHKHKGFIHLYISSFTTSEVDAMCDKISELLGDKPTKRVDRKKDGKEYPYLYLGVILSKKLLSHVQSYCTKHNIHCFDYKLYTIKDQRLSREGVGSK